MVTNRNMQKAILQTLSLEKNELLEQVEVWTNGDTFNISINKVKNTTIVNGALVYLITYKAITKYKKINKATNRIYIPASGETYYIEDVGVDNLWTTLDLKRIEI